PPSRGSPAVGCDQPLPCPVFKGSTRTTRTTPGIASGYGLPFDIRWRTSAFVAYLSNGCCCTNPCEWSSQPSPSTEKKLAQPAGAAMNASSKAVRNVYRAALYRSTLSVACTIALGV